jgi:hypothetical protein
MPLRLALLALLGAVMMVDAQALERAGPEQLLTASMRYHVVTYCRRLNHFSV